VFRIPNRTLQSYGLLSNVQHPSFYSLPGTQLTVAVQLSQNYDARSAETQNPLMVCRVSLPEKF
jgi:hypothetical protein